MENEVKNKGYRLEVNQDVFGVSRPIWVYDEVPPGMRPAKPEDLTIGCPVLHIVRVGPDAGKYYSAYITQTNRRILSSMLASGLPVFIQEQ